MGPATARRYKAAVAEFVRWAAVFGRSLSTTEDVDAAMETFFEELFFAGEPPTRGRFCRCGWLWEHRLGRGSHLLPRANDAIRGWTKGASETARKPCPCIAVLAGALHLSPCGDAARAAARGGLLQFDLFCRPSELLAIRACDVIPPREGPPRQQTMGCDHCAFASRRRLRPSSFDQSW